MGKHEIGSDDDRWLRRAAVGPMDAASGPSTLTRGLALLVLLSSALFMLLSWGAIASSYALIFHPANGSSFNLMPTPSPCDTTAQQPRNANAFWAHMAFMSMAFGLFAPIGAISYTLVRDMLGLPQYIAKAAHGLLQCGALITSILGYQQIYYAHGANCADADGATNT